MTKMADFQYKEWAEARDFVFVVSDPSICQRLVTKLILMYFFFFIFSVLKKTKKKTHTYTLSGHFCPIDSHYNQGYNYIKTCNICNNSGLSSSEGVTLAVLTVQHQMAPFSIQACGNSGGDLRRQRHRDTCCRWIRENGMGWQRWVGGIGLESNQVGRQSDR